MDYKMDKLQKLLHVYIDNPLDPHANAELGEEYEKLGQGAAAVSYFLRASELTHDTDPILAYNGILKTWKQLKNTERRESFEKGQLETAIAYLPTRPEAYLFLSLWYSKREKWKEAYMNACLGLQYQNLEPLPYDIGYLGDWQLKFQKAFTCWYVGLRDLSNKLWLELYNDPYVDENHREIVINNCINFDLIKERPKQVYWHDLLPYSSHDYSNFRFQFKGLKKIKKNYSQCYQDLFVLSMLDGKKKGTYLEIGAGDPYYGNNTALLSEHKWKGISIDYSLAEGSEFIKRWVKERKNDTILDLDATRADYTKLCDTYIKTRHIDYLQLDVDPAYNTYKVLQNIPFDTLSFNVITYEHDYYCDETKKCREQSRKLLKDAGYVLVAGNISPDKNSPYEDWWVNPKYISNIPYKDTKKRVLFANDFMYV